MAGKDVYLGNIMAQLKQDTKDYTTSMELMIQELKNVKNAVTSNIVNVNVAPSDALKASPPHTARGATLNNTEKDYDLLYVKCLVRGVMRIRFSINSPMKAYARCGNVKVTASGRDITLDVPVDSDTFIIGVTGGGNYNFEIIANSLRIYYDIIDIVNNPAISVVG